MPDESAPAPAAADDSQTPRPQVKLASTRRRGKEQALQNVSMVRSADGELVPQVDSERAISAVMFCK